MCLDLWLFDTASPLRLYDAVADAVCRYLECQRGEQVEWNDAPGRTAAEVRAALLGAAERVEAER